MKKIFYLLLSFCLLPGLASAQAGSGYSLDLNGSSQYATAGTINLSGNQITIAGWMKADQFKSGFPFISSFMGIEQGGTNSAFLRLGDATLANNKFQFILSINGTQAKLDGNQGLLTNQWYHVAATYDGSQMRIYINGILDASTSMSGAFSANGLFEIGRNYANSRILDGQLDELTVWSTALSQATIREWMCKKINNTHPDYANLLAYWRLDEGSGGTSIDLSGNSNAATLAGSPTWALSGAYIGDESVNSYSAPYNLSLAHPDGDSIEITSVTGTPDGLHLFRVDSMPNTTNTVTSLGGLETSRYWGVFRIGSGPYSMRYYYGPNTGLTGTSDCALTMARRNGNSTTSWSQATVGSVDIAADTITMSHNASSEFIIGFGSSGVHTLTLAATDVLCNGDASGTAQVTVSGGQSPYTYAWANGSNGNSTSNLAAGWYAVTITDAAGCVSFDSVQVSEPPVLTSNATPNQSNACEDDTDGAINAAAAGGTAPYTYLWNDPSAQTTANATNLATGSYSVTVTDANGCTTTSNASVMFLHPDPVPMLGPDTTICEGDTGLISVGGGPYSSYFWSDNTSNPVFSATAAGTISVSVTNVHGCEGSDTIVVSTVAPANLFIGNDTTVLGSHTVMIGSGFSNPVWSTGATTNSISVDTTGTYSVTAIDGNGCSVSDTIKVTINSIGIEENEIFSNLKFYPNPSHGQITVLWPSAEASGANLEVFSLSGRRVMQHQFSGEEQFDLDLSSLAKGSYIMKISTQKGSAQRLVQLQ